MKQEARLTEAAGIERHSMVAKHASVEHVVPLVRYKHFPLKGEEIVSYKKIKYTAVVEQLNKASTFF
jgi:hypothetical protein